MLGKEIITTYRHTLGCYCNVEGISESEASLVSRVPEQPGLHRVSSLKWGCCVERRRGGWREMRKEGTTRG